MGTVLIELMVYTYKKSFEMDIYPSLAETPILTGLLGYGFLTINLHFKTARS